MKDVLERVVVFVRLDSEQCHCCDVLQTCPNKNGISMHQGTPFEVTKLKITALLPSQIQNSFDNWGGDISHTSPCRPQLHSHSCAPNVSTTLI